MTLSFAFDDLKKTEPRQRLSHCFAVGGAVDATFG
jgi:hypothetical protein